MEKMELAFDEEIAEDQEVEAEVEERGRLKLVKTRSVERKMGSTSREKMRKPWRPNFNRP